MADPEWGKFGVVTTVVQPMSQVWYSACEMDPDTGEAREVARFLNVDEAEAYINWRNTVWDGLYTCPECFHREPSDPGCSNCCRDNQL